MLLITQLGDGVALSASSLAPLAGALVAGHLFIRRLPTCRGAVRPARLLVGHGLGTMNLVIFLFGSFAIGTSALPPLYAQDHTASAPLASPTCCRPPEARR